MREDSVAETLWPSLFGGLDCGTGLWDWTHRKLRSSFRATETTQEVYSFQLTEDASF